MVVKRSPSAVATASTAESIFERFEIEFDAGTSPVWFFKNYNILLFIDLD